VFIFPPLGKQTGTLNEFPIAYTNGDQTGLGTPAGIALDVNSNIYVTNYDDGMGGDDHGVFGGQHRQRSADGNQKWYVRFFSRWDRGRCPRVYLRKLFSAFAIQSLLAVYPPIGTRTGTLNAAPIASFSDGDGVGFEGIALGPNARLYYPSRDVAQPRRCRIYPGSRSIP
jgi:hypothetical protein